MDFIIAWLDSGFVYAPTKELRKFVSRNTKLLFYKGIPLWKNRPPEWPEDILFKDPNNGGANRPRQKELCRMAVFLANQLQLRAGILNVNKSGTRTTERNADGMNSTEMKCLLEPDSSAMIALNMASMYETKTFNDSGQSNCDIDVYKICVRVLRKYNSLLDKKIIGGYSNDWILRRVDSVLRDASTTSEDWCEIMEKMHKLEQVMDCYLMKKEPNVDLAMLLNDLNCLVDKNYGPLCDAISDPRIDAYDSDSATQELMPMTRIVKIENPLNVCMNGSLQANTTIDYEVALRDSITNIEDPLNVCINGSLQANTTINYEVALCEYDQDQMQVNDLCDSLEFENIDEFLDFINEPQNNSVTNNSIASELYLESCLSLDKNDPCSSSEKCDSLLQGQMERTLSCDTNVVIKWLDLVKNQSPADGSCILHSWKTTTGMSVSQTKLAILDEYRANLPLYSARGVDEHELLKYLESGEYDSRTVDSIPEILVNATCKTVYILEDRFTDSITPTGIIKLSVSSEESCCDGSVFLLKSGTHYDALLENSKDIT